MIKFIHTNFEIDLTGIKLQFQEDSQWFNDGFFTKFSFPFEMDVTVNSAVLIPFLSFFSADAQAMYEGKLFRDYEQENAILEIEEVDGETIRATIRYGLEQFANWEKKLKDLPLENREVTNIYTHANTVVSQGFPATNYNFPMVHSNKYNTESGVFEWFQKIINKRVGGAFVQNNVNPLNTSEIYNRNILMPMPYLLHILQAGVSQSGFSLTGDILSDPIFQKLIVFKGSLYERPEKPDWIEWICGIADVVGNWRHPLIRTFATGKRYLSENLIQIYGKFRAEISYKAYYQPFYPEATTPPTVRLNGNIIFQNTNVGGDYWRTASFEFTTGSQGTDMLTYEATALGNPFEVMVCKIIPIELYNPDGTVINYLAESNKIRLQDFVPDITFGDFVKTIKNWFNMEFRFENGQIVMNYIEKYMNVSDAVNLEDQEIKRPKQKFTQGNSYLLKFQDTNIEGVTFQEVFVDKDGMHTEDFTKNEKTLEIVVNGLPLPQRSVDITTPSAATINTADHISDDGSKLLLLMYDGLQGGMNTTISSDELLLPNVYEKCWKKWLRFRILAVTFLWSAMISIHKMIDVKLYRKIYCFGNYMIIKRITRTRVNPSTEDVEIEAQTLR